MLLLMIYLTYLVKSPVGGTRPSRHNQHLTVANGSLGSQPEDVSETNEVPAMAERRRSDRTRMARREHKQGQHMRTPRRPKTSSNGPKQALGRPPFQTINNTNTTSYIYLFRCTPAIGSSTLEWRPHQAHNRSKSTANI